MTDQIKDNNGITLDIIYASIGNNGFSEHTLQLLDNYINNILDGKTDIIQFNQ